MTKGKTHNLVKKPKITARYLADYMAASEVKKRSIICQCKYPAIARITQHHLAKLEITKFLSSGSTNVKELQEAARKIRGQLADNDFERDQLDHNADYIERFAKAFPALIMPSAEILPADSAMPALEFNGVKVTQDIRFRLQRTTKTNKIKVGAVMLRYQKGVRLPEEVALWQSAFIFGALKGLGLDEGVEAERKLCLTIDAYTGIAHEAPTNSVSRFKNMEAACASIAERWPNVEPPKNAII